MKSSSKIIIPILVLFLVILTSIFYYLLSRVDYDFSQILRGPVNLEDVDFANLYSVDDVSFSDGEEVWLFGRYFGDAFRTSEISAFELTEQGNFLWIELNEIERSTTISDENYLLLHGYYEDEEYPVFFANSVEKINEDTYMGLELERFPAVEMEILDEELQLSHGCENASVVVRIKNIGKVPIDYQRIGSGDTEYVFMSVIDEERYSLFPDLDAEKNLVGYLHGLRDFGVIEPGKEKDVRFGLGGMVEITEESTGGTNHIFCANRGDTFQIQFSSVQKKDIGTSIGLEYDFVNTYSSNEIVVDVETCRCILDEKSLPESL